MKSRSSCSHEYKACVGARPLIHIKTRPSIRSNLNCRTALVRFPSVRGEEHAIQDFVFRTLRERGFAMDRFTMDRSAIERHPGGSKISEKHSDAPIVVGIHHPREEVGHSLILQAHVDVVPTGPESLWSHRPFEPVIDGDWMFGRGAADMKAGHAANLFALMALRRIDLQPVCTEN